MVGEVVGGGGLVWVGGGGGLVGAEVLAEGLVWVGEGVGLVGAVRLPGAGPGTGRLMDSLTGGMGSGIPTAAMAGSILTNGSECDRSSKSKGGGLCQDLMEQDRVEWVQ